MLSRRLPRQYGRELRLKVLTRFLASAGTTLIVMAALAQAPAPQPPLTAAGSVGPVQMPTTAPAGPTAAPDPYATAVPAPPPIAEPVAVGIPSIGVTSPLQHLGRTAEGVLEVPTGPRYDEAAWFDGSATPGAVGTAVILGHVDSQRDGPSVFFELGLLRPGDEIVVEREDGALVVFTIDGVRRYPKEEFPDLVVYGDTEHASLRLITCGGAFDRDTGQYDDNIVVFASAAGDADPQEDVAT